AITAAIRFQRLDRAMLASLELHILAAELVYAAKRRCSQTIDVTRGLASSAATAKVNLALHIREWRLNYLALFGS
ncbi:MAG: hypothetical protein L7W43_12555, partial [Rubripirellula sp.]|nr:hypothetical protein [Rubripirellula sp.]